MATVKPGWDRKSDGFRLQNAGKNKRENQTVRFPQDFPSHLEPFKFEVVNSGLKTRVKKRENYIQMIQTEVWTHHV